MELDENKLAHIKYLTSKGKFKFECKRAIFDPHEVECITDYGHWFQGLTSGELAPFTEEQEHFVAVATMQAKPETDNERAWFKYLKRSEIEDKYADSLNKSFQLDEDTFYTRKQAKELRKSMFVLTNENHRKLL